MTEALDDKPAIKTLETIATEADPFETSAMIRTDNGDEFKLIVTTDKWFVSVYAVASCAPYPDMSAPKTQPNEERPFLQRNYRSARPGKSWFSPGEKEYTLSEAMTFLSTALPNAVLLVDTIKINANGSSIKGPELKQAATEAWCEAMGIAVPSTKELKVAKRSSKELAADKRRKLVEQLRSGKAGIEEWNRKSHLSKMELDLNGLDLSGADLTNMNLSNLNFDGTNFSGANFTGAKFDYTHAQECNFKDAIFHDVNVEHFNGTGSSFDNAHFKNARGSSTFFNNAKLTNARFENADLQYGLFHGADLTGATFINCQFEKMMFDVQTVLPNNFDFDDEFQFEGAGIDPRKLGVQVDDRDQR